MPSNPTPGKYNNKSLDKDLEELEPSNRVRLTLSLAIANEFTAIKDFFSESPNEYVDGYMLVADLGTLMRKWGLRYVALSRVGPISRLDTGECSNERLREMRESTNLLPRQEEKRRLGKVAEQTLARYEAALK